jgi:hypothetical protein
MPIRFRCAYCNQLMGIARRKAGSVVNCPKCNGPLVVPHPDPEAEADGPPPNPSAKPNPFERADFDLDSFDPKPHKSLPAGTGPTMPAAAYEEFDVQPVALPSPEAPPSPETVMRRRMLLVVGALLLVAIAFAAGVVVGRMM